MSYWLTGSEDQSSKLACFDAQWNHGPVESMYSKHHFGNLYCPSGLNEGKTITCQNYCSQASQQSTFLSKLGRLHIKLSKEDNPKQSKDETHGSHLLWRRPLVAQTLSAHVELMCFFWNKNRVFLDDSLNSSSKKTQKTPQNATKKKSKQQQTTKTSPSFGTTPRSRPPLKLCVPLGWNPWLCPVPNLARKMTTQNGQNGGIPKHFQRIPCFATSFLGGSESKNVDGTLSWDLYNSYKSMLDYITWGFCLEWKCCRKFGCPFAHAFAVHGSCTTPVWFQHPNKKSQGSTARFLKRPSLGSWCPFPTIPALKQEVSKAVDLCKILILEPWIFPCVKIVKIPNSKTVELESSQAPIIIRLGKQSVAAWSCCIAYNPLCRFRQGSPRGWRCAAAEECSLEHGPKFITATSYDSTPLTWFFGIKSQMRNKKHIHF